MADAINRAWGMMRICFGHGTRDGQDDWKSFSGSQCNGLEEVSASMGVVVYRTSSEGLKQAIEEPGSGWGCSLEVDQAVNTTWGRCS